MIVKHGFPSPISRNSDSDREGREGDDKSSQPTHNLETTGKTKHSISMMTGQFPSVGKYALSNSKELGGCWALIVF